MRILHLVMTTKPAPNNARPSAVCLASPSALVLVAMGLGLTAAEAVALQASRLAETARLSAFEVSP
jgi:hypothetical protein